MKQFGVIKNLIKEENRWFIKYDDPIDESTAFQNLKNSRFKVSKVADTYRMQYETSTLVAENQQNYSVKSAAQQQVDKTYAKEVQVVDGSTTMVKMPRSKNQGNKGGFCEYMRANPRRVWCGCQYLCCLAFFVASFIVSLTGSILMMATSFGRNLKVSTQIAILAFSIALDTIYTSICKK